MSRLELGLWVALPYAAIAVFLTGHWWRYRRDQLGWTTRSTQLLERRLLRPGSLLFHWGALAAIGGHVLGILVPASLTEALGVPENLYHLVSVGAGSLAALAVLAGLAILLYRRVAVPRVAATTTPMDWVTYALLTAVIVLGSAETIGVNLLGGGYDYRQTVAVWLRGIFLLDPRPELMVSAPPVYQLHAAAAWVLFAVWPFTRLVHVWSAPVTYLSRVSILYRRRAPAASRR